ncbi:MAG TPA: CpsB/CapC family capsule biosynthesis tyrosine phosphatase [Gemmatimonadales bacterium]|nr:CpsB/CapC family capsule biosynthesis tyrosine phosphatase [Gemmatimonadales bacterium]
MIVDLHSHFVPGVDDGAASVAEALEALQALRAEDVVTAVTTPHLLLPWLETGPAVDHELDRHRRAFETLTEAAAGRNDLPALGLGQEILAPDAATLRRALGRPGLGLGGTSYLLVEFGFDLEGDHLDVVRAVADAGRRIVVSHAERYRYPPGFDPVETVRVWREEGGLIQVNAGSLTGAYERSNPGARALAWRFIEEDLADLIATDHHARNRPVSPRDAWDALVAAGRQPQAERLMFETPGRIVRDEAVAWGRAT